MPRRRPTRVRRTGVDSLPGRLLVDLPNWLGDFVHTVPAVQALLATDRWAETTLLVPASHVPLAGALGARVVVRPAGAGWRWSTRLAGGAFDVALTARHSLRAKLLLAGVDASRKLASRGRGAGWLGLTSFRVDRRRHQRHDLDEALGNLGVAAVPDVPALLPLSPALRHSGQRARRLLAGGERTAVLLPGCSHQLAKRYPPEQYGEVGAALRGAGWRVLVAGGPGEEGLLGLVAATSGAVVVPTAWGLDRLAGLLASCQAAVGNDSGLAHLAAVVGCPTVMLFGPTDPRRTGAVGGARVLREAGGRGLAGLCPQRVAWAVQALGGGQGLHVPANEAMITVGSGPLAQLAEQETLNL
jgi:ADP-heptose:LPS heptosyltransferase